MFIDTLTSQAPIALGFTATEWVDMLNTDRAAYAVKALNYLDGEQEEELKVTLSKHRKNWMQKGLIPRTRNITGMVVEKSGMLFKDAMPVMEVFNYNASTPNMRETALFNEQMSRKEFSEWWANFEQMVRLLKTGIVLQQANSETGEVALDVLHRGNCEVVLQPDTKNVIGMIYRMTQNTYAVWTEEQIIMLMTGDNSEVWVSSQEDNPYNMIPITVFYDVRSPRAGFWVEADTTLVGINELYNLHLTDGEHSALWLKQSTLFTNMSPKTDGTGQTHMEEVYKSKLGPRLMPGPGSDVAVMAGPGTAVVMNSTGVDNPMLKYESPNVPLDMIDTVVNGWVTTIAADWSVRLEVAGSGRASSGFQLVVEEMDNLDLRKRRQRMFESGFKRFFETYKQVANLMLGVDVFSEDTDLFVIFSEPQLPVDAADEENVWNLRIENGRASDLDYFRHKEGLSKEEAMEKIKEIHEYNLWKAKLDQELTAITQPVEQTIPAVDDNIASEEDEQA